MARPFLVSPEQAEDVAERYRSGESAGQIAAHYSVSDETIRRTLNRADIKLDKKTRRRSDEQRQRISAGLNRAYASGARQPRRGPVSPEWRAKLLNNIAKAREAARKYKPGDRVIDPRFGHILVCVPPGQGTSQRNFIPEHRLIASGALGRKLKRHEIVHHINGDPADNRNSNLLVCTQRYHAALHARMANLYQLEHFGGG